MDYIREMLEAGSRIMDTVDDAIEHGDFSNLTKKITEEMSGYTKNAKKDVKQKMYNAGKTYRVYTNYNVNRGPRNASGYRPVDIDLGTRKKSSNQRTGAGNFTGAKTGAGYDAGQAYNERRKQQSASWNYSTRPNNQYASANKKQGTNVAGSANAQPRPTNPNITPFNQYKKNAGSGILKQTAGVTGLFITVPVVVANVAAAAATGGLSTLVTAAMFGAGAGVSGYFTKKGSRQRKLSKIFDKYSKIVGTAEYMTIEDLAEMAGEDPEIVQKNLNEMIEFGMLPQLKFDQKKTTMMLTKNAYDQYLLAENSRKEREKEEAELDAQAGSAEARKVISEGEAFVAKIKKSNELIPGEEMTSKLTQMERIVSKIFAKVKEDPASAGDLRKFMNYYLPTTEKLLDAYVDLDKQPEIGENIPKTKREIESTIDTINDAFENLLDSLFEEVAWDISSDISVMKTMMEQDGLMKKGIADTKVTTAGEAAASVASDVDPTLTFDAE